MPKPQRFTPRDLAPRSLERRQHRHDSLRWPLCEASSSRSILGAAPCSRRGSDSPGREPAPRFSCPGWLLGSPNPAPGTVHQDRLRTAPGKAPGNEACAESRSTPGRSSKPPPGTRPWVQRQRPSTSTACMQAIPADKSRFPVAPLHRQSSIPSGRPAYRAPLIAGTALFKRRTRRRLKWPRFSLSPATVTGRW